MSKAKTTTGKGLSRFDTFLTQLEQLLAKAAKQKNPALWLYQNNARTPAFMLEALSKIYASLHNKKKFSKLKEHFKLLEDAIGAIDYYDSFAKEFSKDKKIPATITAYLEAQSREKIQRLNELLEENNWLSNRISKTREKLTEASWLPEDKEISEIKKYYDTEIKAIIKFAKGGTAHFDNVEADVHELRRKLRWLSIYPQALQGSIQLSKIKTNSKHLQKYLTKEIINLSYNKFPDAGDNKHFLLLEQSYFYALSWMIGALGELKDNGLRIIAIKEAMQQAGTVDDDTAYKKAAELTGSKQLPIKKILSKANSITATFFKEKNLEHLVIGTGAVK